MCPTYESEITKNIEREIKVTVMLINFTKTVLRRNPGQSPQKPNVAIYARYKNHKCLKIRHILY